MNHRHPPPMMEETLEAMVKSKILAGQQGIALLMVTSAVAILSFLLIDFTYNSQLNKIKVGHQMNQVQARLNAESGLKLALANLRLYQEGRNLLEKNNNLKGVVTPEKVERFLLAPFQPFVLPIPLPKGANLIQKNAVGDFQKNTLLPGSIMLEVKPISGFINPNTLRLLKKKEDTGSSTGSFDDNDDADDDSKDSKANQSPQFYVEKTLTEALEEKMREKREEDEEFNNLYANVDPMMLVKELKFFVNPKGAVDEPEMIDIQGRYDAKNLTAKHAPLTSIDELYLLEGWDDAIINLIKDDMTVHEAGFIALNEIDKDQLKILFPDITPIQIEEFFKHRDGDAELEMEPNRFKSVEEFKEVIVRKLGIMDDQNFDQRIKEFEGAGLKIGVAGKLYKVLSVGRSGESEVKLTAFIDLPILPPPPSKKPPQDGNNPDFPPPEPTPNPDDSELVDPGPNEGEGKKEEKPPLELLAPRVIEITR